MKRSEQINETLKRKAYRQLNSPRLKPTPDLAYPVPVLNQDEVEEAQLILNYEHQLQDKKKQRGY